MIAGFNTTNCGINHGVWILHKGTVVLEKHKDLSQTIKFFTLSCWKHHPNRFYFRANGRWASKSVSLTLVVTATIPSPGHRLTCVEARRFSPDLSSDEGWAHQRSLLPSYGWVQTLALPSLLCLDVAGILRVCFNRDGPQHLDCPSDPVSLLPSWIFEVLL